MVQVRGALDRGGHAPDGDGHQARQPLSGRRRRERDRPVDGLSGRLLGDAGQLGADLLGRDGVDTNRAVGGRGLYTRRAHVGTIAHVWAVLVVTRAARVERENEELTVEINETSMPAEQFAVSYAVTRDKSAAWPREAGAGES